MALWKIANIPTSIFFPNLAPACALKQRNTVAKNYLLPVKFIMDLYTTQGISRSNMQV